MSNPTPLVLTDADTLLKNHPAVYAQYTANAPAKDLDLFESFVIDRVRTSGPKLGDWVKLPDGTYERLANDRQTAPVGKGSFYIGAEGMVSYSGGFSYATLTKSTLRHTGEYKYGPVWTFSSNQVKAGNRVDAEVLLPVYSYGP